MKTIISKLLVFFMLMAMLVSMLPTNIYAKDFSSEGGDAGVSVAANVYENVYQSSVESINLALNKPVTITQPDAIFDTIQGIGKYGKETDLTKSSMLTDGKYGNVNSWGDTKDWFVFYRKLKREVVVDLGDIQTVNRLQIGFGQTSSVGIVPPLNVRYYVSNDGADYRYVGLAEPDIPLYYGHTTSNPDYMHRKVYRLDQYVDGSELNVQARYVKLVFVINTFGWADEIEVVGKPGIVNGAVVPPVVHDGLHVDQLPAPGSPEAANITDQFLWYSGPMSEANKRFTDWTKEKALSMLGYLDLQGNIKDWYFNDLLAIPVVQMITPSGLDSAGNARFITKEDLLAYLNFIFKSDTQLGAIDWAAGEVNKKLGTNKKVRINMSIPWIENSSNFGDIRGDNSKLSTNPADFASQVSDPSSMEGKLEMHRLAVENKKLAFKWYIDEVLRRFEEAGYANLYIDSFYWYHERILEAQGEVDAIKSTADYLKSKQLFFTWIPYIGPSSPYVWRDLGFTAASIQPGFAFNNSKKAIFPEITKLAKRVGASVEIEYDDYRTLAQYLNYGLSEGYMNTFNTYYMAAMPIVDGAYAFSPVDKNKVSDAMSAIRRSVYDRVYEYKNGSYERRFTANLITDVADKTKMTATVKLPLANQYVEGALEVVYDADKVELTGFTVPTASKAVVHVNSSEKPGVAKVQFSVADPQDALTADLQAKRDPLRGAPDLVTLQFAKKSGAADSDITTRSFVMNSEGYMKDVEGRTYLNFTSSDIVPGSKEEQFAAATSAVVKAEATYFPTDIATAKALVNALPDGNHKTAYLARISAIENETPIKIVKLSEETSFKLGEEAKVTVKATVQSSMPSHMTLIMGLYDKNTNKLISYNSIKQVMDSGKSVDVTGMLKLPSTGRYEVKCFVWDTMEGMIPLSETINIEVK